MQTQSTGSLFKNTAIKIVVLFLAVQAVAFYAFSRTEYIPPTRPFTTFPSLLGPYRMIEEGSVDPEILDVLKADDILTRSYAGSDGIPVNLFIAAFKTQRNGKAPHSPKNCLPGSGWSQLVNEQMTIDLPIVGPRKVNHYVVAKGTDRSSVIYWYQSRDRIIGSEYSAKLYAILDSIRYNRSDTAIVRVIVPVLNGDQAGADKRAIEFIQSAFPAVQGALPR
jgi:EpsI family protein